jgi:hypothetical protein
MCLSLDASLSVAVLSMKDGGTQLYPAWLFRAVVVLLLTLIDLTLPTKASKPSVL